MLVNLLLQMFFNLVHQRVFFALDAAGGLLVLFLRLVALGFQLTSLALKFQFFRQIGSEPRIAVALLELFLQFLERQPARRGLPSQRR